MSRRALVWALVALVAIVVGAYVAALVLSAQLTADRNARTADEVARHAGVPVSQTVGPSQWPGR